MSLLTVSNPVNLSQTGARIFNVKDNQYGAVGDGIVDDTAAIEEAVQDANVGGGTIYFPGGTYITSGGHEIGDFVKIVGEDKNSTIVKLKDASNTYIFANNNQVTTNDGISLIDIQIDGNAANQGVLCTPLSFAGIRNMTISHVIAKKGKQFTFFLGGASGTVLGGIITLTKGSRTVTGAGTAFLTDFVPGDVIRSGSSARCTSEVAEVTNDAELLLRYPWSFDTEAGTAFKIVNANDNFQVNDFSLEAEPGVLWDVMGGGLWHNFNISNIHVVGNAGGNFGVGFTSCQDGNFTNIYVEDVLADGIGIENGMNLQFVNCHGIRCASNAIKAILGSHALKFTNCSGIGCAVGFSMAWEQAYSTTNNQIEFVNCTAELNEQHGFRLNAVENCKLVGCVSRNNSQTPGTGSGYTLESAFGVGTNGVEFVGCEAYDNQTVKSQVYGINIGALSTNTVINGGEYEDNLTARFNDAASGTKYIAVENTTGVWMESDVAFLFRRQSTTPNPGDFSTILLLDNDTTGTERSVSLINDTPESFITAPAGSLAIDYNGGASSTLYVKESGAGNTGWESVITSAGGTIDGTLDISNTTSNLILENTTLTAGAGDYDTIIKMKTGTIAAYRYIGIGNGSPEGTYTAPPGSLAINYNGGEAQTLYIKRAGTLAVDWEPVQTFSSYGDSTGTPGAAILNVTTGRFALDATDTSVIITNNKVSATSVVQVTKESLDATLSDYSVVCGAGTITVTGNAAATADVNFSFVVFN